MSFNSQVLQLLNTIHLNQTQKIIPALTQLGTNMAEDFTALNAALSGLQAEVGTIGTQMDTLLADLSAAHATGNQPAIDAATAAIQAQIDALKAAATRDMPPAPPAP
jgi:hypothetical protein